VQEVNKSQRVVSVKAGRIVVFIICSVLAFGGCAQPRSDKPTLEAAKQVLKLRGYEFNEKAFFAAATASDLMAVNAFLDAGINPNAQDETSGMTVLISAASRGQLEVVNAVLKGKANVNVKDKQGYTALFRALQAHHEAVADVLLTQQNLDLSARGLNGVTALISYVWRDRKDAVQTLLERGADVNLQDHDGDTALHGAALNGNVGILQMLLAKDANPNVKNKVGGTPLMWAAVYGHEEAARALLDHGADASLKDEDGVTAAAWAAKNRRDEMVKLLRAAESH